MVFNFFYLQIFTTFLKINQFFFLILLTGTPATRQEKGRGEIFNPPPLVSPPSTAPF
jgi:hypothetical protein